MKGMELEAQPRSGLPMHIGSIASAIPPNRHGSILVTGGGGLIVAPRKTGQSNEAWMKTSHRHPLRNGLVRVQCGRIAGATWARKCSMDLRV